MIFCFVTRIWCLALVQSGQPAALHWCVHGPKRQPHGVFLQSVCRQSTQLCVGYLRLKLYWGQILNQPTVGVSVRVSVCVWWAMDSSLSLSICRFCLNRKYTVKWATIYVMKSACYTEFSEQMLCCHVSDCTKLERNRNQDI